MRQLLHNHLWNFKHLQVQVELKVQILFEEKNGKSTHRRPPFPDEPLPLQLLRENLKVAPPVSCEITFGGPLGTGAAAAVAI